MVENLSTRLSYWNMDLGMADPSMGHLVGVFDFLFELEHVTT